MANGNGTSISELRQEVEKLEAQKDRAKQEEAERKQTTDTVVAYGITTVALGVSDSIMPSLGSIKPLAEVAGMAYGIAKAYDGGSDRGKFLGVGLASSQGVLQRVTTFVKDTVGKFKK